MPDILDRLRDPRGLARALSAVVDRDPGAEELLRNIYRTVGTARVIGLTGPPGSGKSTLVDGLARRFRQQELSVGVVAVDPTSPFTGGAILGDRIRMQAHHADPGIFIRSLATRGALGGLAAAASDVVAVFDAAGKQRILVETVGVGQDEVDIIQLADVTAVVLVPGMGDEVQAIKAGLMEIADIFVINKADRPSDRLEQEIKAMLALAPGGREAWRPPIIKTIATTGEGLDLLDQALTARFDWLQARGGLEQHRARQWRQRLRQFARDRLAARLLDPLLSEDRLQDLADRISRHGDDPYSAVDALIAEALATR